jgi:hypothetical protein
MWRNAVSGCASADWIGNAGLICSTRHRACCLRGRGRHGTDAARVGGRARRLGLGYAVVGPRHGDLALAWVHPAVYPAGARVCPRRETTDRLGCTRCARAARVGPGCCPAEAAPRRPAAGVPVGDAEGTRGTQAARTASLSACLRQPVGVVEAQPAPARCSVVQLVARVPARLAGRSRPKRDAGPAGSIRCSPTLVRPLEHVTCGSPGPQTDWRTPACARRDRPGP